MCIFELEKKRRKGSGKGSAYEREFCKALGMWWTDGARDDVFWRTSNSGGRATVRGRRSTFGQAGDVQATDPIGQPLMDVLSFELKCGYPSVSLLDFFEDKQPKVGISVWIEQAKAAAEMSGASYWAVIWKRNRRKPIIFFPRSFAARMMRVEKYSGADSRFVFQGGWDDSINAPSNLVVMSFDAFLTWCTRDMILEIQPLPPKEATP